MPTVAATDGDGAEFEVSAVVRAVLASTQNEVTLPGALQGHALTFAMSFADGKDEGEVIASLPEEPEEWMITFAEAWQAATEKLMPSIVHKRASVWAGAEVPPPPKIKDAGKSFPVLGGGASGASAPAATSVGDEGLAESLSGLNVSDHDVPKAIEDIKAQGISGARILALSLALMSGHVHPMGDSAELRYASDLRLCPLIRQQRKAGVQSLDDILKAKNKRELFLHYTRLAKEYNDRKMIEEATLVSQFWAETSAAFEGDDVGLFVYIVEWNRSYGGRGIPKLLDTDLILRNRKHAEGGASTSEVKELKEQLKVAKANMNASDDRSSSMMKRLQKLEQSVRDGPITRAGKEGKEIICFICGGNHLARNCPNKDDKESGKGKDKKAGKKVTIKEEDGDSD